MNGPIFRHIQPICLPLGKNLRRDYVGTLPVALGWGTTHYGGEEVAKLRGVPLPVWTNGDCDDAYFQPITGMMSTSSENNTKAISSILLLTLRAFRFQTSAK